MDNSLLDTARSLYESGDFEHAREAFVTAISSARGVFAPGESGYAYHMMGNCLIKQRRYQEAIAAYREALKDTGYAKRGALCVNLGMAQSALKDFPTAIDCFETALADESYETPYKALAAMGNAQLKMGDPTAAGTSYRKAALEPNNPDPAKSLVNLGVCFMALNRPSDAVESYITALKFESDQPSRNKTQANLGQAYVATGRMKEAVESFESATADGEYHLSRAAFIDYDRAKASLEADAAEDSGLDNFNSPYAAPSDFTGRQDVYQPTSDFSVIPPADDTGFFTMTEDEMNQMGREEIRESRKQRNIGPKIFLVIAILLLVIVAFAGVSYYRGYGYPMQETVIQDMFTAYAADQPVTDYWAQASTSDIDAAMSSVAKTDNIAIDYVDRTMSKSTAEVTATLADGGQVYYTIELGRDGITWKITNIQLDFNSRDY